MYKKIKKYLVAHPMYNSAVHVLAGMGIGILVTYPYIDHPMKVGGLLLALGIAGHLYPLTVKK